MFEKIRIKNFRGIKHASIEDLKQVNLFFGKNNCGKSSLLEAIFLVSGQSNPLLPININQWRDFLNTDEDNLALNFYNLDKSNPISIVFESTTNDNRALEINTFHTKSKTVDITKAASQSTTDNSGDFYGLRLKYSKGKKTKEFKSEIVFDNNTQSKDKVQIVVDQRYEESVFAKYLSPKFQFETAIQYIKQLLNDKQKEIILKPLQKIDSRIKDVSLVDTEVWVDVGLNSFIPINVMGDGIRKLLVIIISIYECKNGILLIDEIDNGFHFSTMPILWAAILESARINNTQLFITTHNIDSLKGLTQEMSTELHSDMHEMVAAHKIIHKADGELNVVTYNYNQFVYSIQQEIEVR